MTTGRDKKVVLVTGCTKGGIGYALCAQFARLGCKVFATARKVDSMAGLQELGCTLLALDITDKQSVQTTVRQVLKAAGRIDVLVNNAGISGRGALAEYDMAEARKQFDVNVFGTMAMVQAVVPRMLAQKSGTIINVGSGLGLLTLPFASVYCASKKAMHAMTDALRMELAGSGIKVVYSAPGWVRSNIIDTMANTGLNCLNKKGPWAPCAPYITGNLYQVEAKHAWTPEQFAEGFCRMALSSNPPYIWLNSFRDGWIAYLGSLFVPSFIMDVILQYKYNLGAHLFNTSTIA
jgi:1-acylglycerone phosphate reductase